MNTEPTIEPTPGVYDGVPMVHLMLDSWATNGDCIQSDGLTLDQARDLATAILDAVTTAANTAHQIRRARFTTVVVTHRYDEDCEARDLLARRLATQHGGTDAGGGYDIVTNEREVFFDFEDAAAAHDFTANLSREFRVSILEAAA